MTITYKYASPFDISKKEILIEADPMLIFHRSRLYVVDDVCIKWYTAGGGIYVFDIGGISFYAQRLDGDEPPNVATVFTHLW